ncbi:MAG: cytochrome c3 family protein [Planctomycetota bacterium]|nr:cytochrome c3 family protein [Planctomycetota bacterium]
MYKCNDFCVVLIVSLAVGVVTLLSCTPASDSDRAEVRITAAESESESTSGPPPLVVDTSEPLLLEEPTEEQATAAITQAAAENMACFVCHGNYRGEFLAECHAKADVGCVSCHGDSFAHRNDENNTTPPETMYPAEKIDPFCQGCHDVHDVPARKIIARWIEEKVKKPDAACEGCHKDDDVPPEKVVARWKELEIDNDDPARIVCTDCHGEHRMKVRTVIWDKETGKLLRTNRGD